MTVRIRPFHWVGRFVSSLWPAPPSSDDRRWAASFLSDEEATLFDRMSGSDQRHAIAVARRFDEYVAAVPVDRRQEAMAAALLHDVGKTSSGLGTYGRVVATVCGLLARDMAEAWQATSGFTRKVGLYLRYGEMGAEQLTMAGSAPWVIAWAVEHHLDEAEWTLPVEVGRLLREADRG